MCYFSLMSVCHFTYNKAAVLNDLSARECTFSALFTSLGVFSNS